MVNSEFDPKLILAAEEFPDDEFKGYHVFSQYEDKIIRKLISHSPVLLRGGRGSGKSTLLKEAYFRTNVLPVSESVFGVYLSLRSLPLLRSNGKDYEKFFCNILIDKITSEIGKHDYQDLYFDSEPEVDQIQEKLTELSVMIQKRVVLFFDDAAHIGRETSLKEFFDIFRTLSNNTISCKAAIYPGVTEFGQRFDLLNDANVIDISRNEESIAFTNFFSEIMKKRYADIFIDQLFTTISFDDVANFLGRAVTGNVRAFIYACNYISEQTEGSTITLPDLEKTLKYLAAEYYWPLLDELKPKLGCYEPLIEPTTEIAEKLYKVVSELMDKPEYGASCLIYRENVEKLKKVFELLEYTGFLVKRDASRAMKAGGRGVRYRLNLCNLMEVIPGGRLTHELFNRLISTETQFTQLHKGSFLEKISLPAVSELKDLGILEFDLDVLKKSKAYPYGLTPRRIEVLHEAGINTVGELAETADEFILGLDSISYGWLNRIKSVVGQAIWM